MDGEAQALANVHGQLRERWAEVRAGGWNDAQPVPSPCVSVCRLDPANRQCEGCLRTLDELRRWREAGTDERLVIWGELMGRLDALATPIAPVR